MFLFFLITLKKNILSIKNIKNTFKITLVGTSFVLSGIGPEYFWLWCQSNPEWPPQDSNLGGKALTPVRCPPGTIWASTRAKNTLVQSRIKQMMSQQKRRPFVLWCPGFATWAQMVLGGQRTGVRALPPKFESWGRHPPRAK